MYIGPERRKDQRRVGWTADDHPRHRGSTDRRLGIDRRQEALAGVIVGLTAEQMQILVALHRASEEERVHICPPITYDEIITREA